MVRFGVMGFLALRSKRIGLVRVTYHIDIEVVIGNAVYTQFG